MPSSDFWRPQAIHHSSRSLQHSPTYLRKFLLFLQRKYGNCDFWAVNKLLVKFSGIFGSAIPKILLVRRYYDTVRRHICKDRIATISTSSSNYRILFFFFLSNYNFVKMQLAVAVQKHVFEQNALETALLTHWEEQCVQVFAPIWNAHLIF